MTQVYVVTDGSYSDYHIVACFMDKQKAELLAERCGMFVEEWDLDPDFPVLNKELTIYQVCMNYHGKVASVTGWETPESVQRYPVVEIPNLEFTPRMGKTLACFWARVLARSKEHAVKICNEYRTRWIASNEWTPDGLTLPAEASEHELECVKYLATNYEASQTKHR